MYTPQNMKMSCAKAISAFISEFGFGTLISPDLEATRLPLIFDTNAGVNGAITGHFAKANHQWKDLSGKRVSVLFNGPHSYISPTWYISSPAVPTWNYASVQCFGIFTLLDNASTLASIDALIEKYEPEIASNRHLMPSKYVERLLKAVVGFNIDVDEIHAKEKLGQHKKTADQLGVVNALSKSENNDAIQLARYMKQRGVGIGKL